jgi:hypothetical protein
MGDSGSSGSCGSGTAGPVPPARPGSPWTRRRGGRPGAGLSKAGPQQLSCGWMGVTLGEGSLWGKGDFDHQK